MKIRFTKLKTSAANITVKYDEVGDNTISYPVSEIKANNNEIEFDGSLCVDLDNIEISANSETTYKPEFNENNDYDALFEHLNGCKTAKWVIDEEHFPYTWKKLFSPDHVFHSYKLYKIEDKIENVNPSRYYNLYIYNETYYNASWGNIEHAQKLLDAYPWAFDGHIYISDSDSDSGYKEYSSGMDINRSLYLKTSYYFTTYNDEVRILNDIIISDKTYKVIENNSNFYITDMSTGIALRLRSCQDQDATFVAYPQNYYFEEVDQNGQYVSSHYSYDPWNSDRYYYRSSLDGYYNFIPTDEYETGRLDYEDYSEYNNLISELKEFFNNTDSSFKSANNYNTPVYKIYVDGYDLQENVELSRKILEMVTVLQHSWNVNSFGWFPFISYSSFNDTTLSDEDYMYSGRSDYLVNCNSIIKLLGRRRICNYYNWYDSNTYYINNASELEDGYYNNSKRIFIYERNLKDGDSFPSYGSYVIVPSSRSLPVKTIHSYNSEFQFLNGTNPKNNIIIEGGSIRTYGDHQEFFEVQTDN